MRKHILFILLPFLLLGLKSKAQDSLVISPYSFVVGSDSVVTGTVDSVKFYLVNIASTPSNDSLSIYISVQDSTSAFIYHPIDSLNFPATVIAPGDSTPITLYVDYTVAPFRFHYDINVIVIWPLTASSTSILDSIFYLEFIDTLADGVEEFDLSKYLGAYPNPVKGDLGIRNESRKSIEEVRIYDPLGRICCVKKDPDPIICTEEWTPGTYLIRLRLSDNRTHTLKVVKQ